MFYHIYEHALKKFYGYLPVIQVHLNWKLAFYFFEIDIFLNFKILLLKFFNLLQRTC